MAYGKAELGAGSRSSVQQFMMDEGAENKSKKGCFVSCPLGVLAVLLALLVAGGVGTAVYFLAPRYQTEAQAWNSCIDLAEKRGECACPASLTTTTVAPTTEPPAPTTTTAPPLPTGNRLNRTLIPSHYQVKLWPRFYPGDDFTFTGSVVIDMKCEVATNEIVMHAHVLTIHDNTVKLTRTDMNTTETLEITGREEDTSRQHVRMHVNQALVQGATYRLSMEFNGTHIHDDWAGFYRSSYEEDGVTKWLVTTQFQRTDARRAFPCFDEPSFKATFDITLTRKSDHTSISNMDLTASNIRYLVLTFMAPAYARRVMPCFDEPSFKATFDLTLTRKTGFSTIANMPLDFSSAREDGWIDDVYNTTVVMPTYLLAFVISEFQSKELTTPRGTFMRLWARPKFIQYVDYALNISGPTLEALEDYTGIKYPLPKTDQIAVPDFSAGAMENWGLVTYRETALLVNDDYTDTSSKRYVATVIAHELAHQWWGNLVTCEWWDETWLNEGFANNYADPITGQVEKGWKMDKYWLRIVWSALSLDGKSTSQPVFVAGIEHHDSLEAAFDLITYEKGGSVIRMMKYFLSEETFQRGISTYLSRHAYGNTRREDLYKALEEQAVIDGQVSWDTSKVNFSTLMDTWIAQMGHPVVSVADWGNGSIQVSQKHFLYDSSSKVDPSPIGGSDYLWHIPLTFADKTQLANNNNYSRVWIYRDQSTLIDGVSATPGWKLVNLFEQGFYRVQYSAAIWDSIITQLNADHTVFPVENRGKLINDAFNLAKAGLVAEVDALKSTQYLAKETEYLPIYAGLVTRLKTIENWLYPTDLQSEMNTYIYNLVKDKYASTSWDNSNPDEHLEKYIRTMILRENCVRRNKACLNKATELYATFMATPDKNPIHPDFRAFVYCTAIDIGGAAEFEHLQNRLDLMEATKRHEEFIGYEVNALKSGLACVRQPYLVQRYIDYVVDKEDSSMLQALAGRWQNQALVWDFLALNWGNSTFEKLRTGLLNSITTYWSTDSHMKKVQDLARDNPVPSWDDTFTKVLDKIKSNRAWIETNEKPIGDYIKSVNSAKSKTEEQGASRQKRDTLASVRHIERLPRYIDAVQ